MTSSIFKDNYQAYREAGYQPRPIKHRTKLCPIKGWSKPDDDFTQGDLQSWPEKYAAHGIGILLGSKCPDGTRLGALDIDHDDYVRVASTLLGNPICGRIGAKGIAYLVRVKGDLGVKKFDVKRQNGEVIHIGELLCQKRLLVLPPTIHPDTNRPYVWVGKPLLEVDYTDLPIVEV